MDLSEKEQADLLRAELDRQQVTDPEMRAGIAAIAMGESGFRMRPEQDYAHTAVSRIREIFGHRVAGLADDQIEKMKADPVWFFNYVYGGAWGYSNLGNTESDDGYRFRGRGLLQLTGRANYKRYGDMIGLNLVGNPDLADNPKDACAIAVAYMRDRYHGGGWEAMKAAVGNSIADVAAQKDLLFERYMASGEFLARPSSDPPATDPAVTEFANAVVEVQRFLKTNGYYVGDIDGDFGPQSHAALQQYLRHRA